MKRYFTIAYLLRYSTGRIQAEPNGRSVFLSTQKDAASINVLITLLKAIVHAQPSHSTGACIVLRIAILVFQIPMSYDKNVYCR